MPQRLHIVRKLRASTQVRALTSFAPFVTSFLLSDVTLNALAAKHSVVQTRAQLRQPELGRREVADVFWGPHAGTKR